MNKYKKGDMVLVTNGKDAGKKGKVVKVIAEKQRVIIENINLVKRHLKPTQESKGGIVDTPAPLHWSKVMLICPASGKPTKVSYVIKDGQKKRKAKSSGEIF